MIYLIKTDGKETYFFNKLTKTVQNKYENDDNLVFVSKLNDGRIINIENSAMNVSYGGQLTFDFDNDKFIVEDGFRNNLIRAGYIIKDIYNNESYHIYDKDEGLAVRQSIYDKLIEVVDLYVAEHPEVKIDYSVGVPNIRIKSTDDTYHEYIICFDTINSIVSKNQQRKNNNLTFYPFLKNMDKYGTFYLSIFAQYTGEEKDLTSDIIKAKYAYAEKTISDFMRLINQGEPHYKFERIVVKKKIGYQEGI